MKKVYLLPVFALTILMLSCGGGTEEIKKETVKKVKEIKEEIVEEVEEVIEEVEETVNLTNIGIGPIKELKLEGDIDEAMAKKGKDLYASKGCTACHNATMTIIGPAPEGIFERRNPAWVMNMIMNTEEMLEKDKDAIALLEEYNNVVMTPMELTEEETRSILEYFRTI